MKYRIKFSKHAAYPYRVEIKTKWWHFWSEVKTFGNEACAKEWIYHDVKLVKPKSGSIIFLYSDSDQLFDKLKA